MIAPERGAKPETFKLERQIDVRTLDAYDANCPFCLGNEERFDIAPLSEISSQDGTWQARLIENKYKIFDAYASCPAEPEPFTRYGVHFLYKGCGDHFLVLEHSQHNKVSGNMTPQELSSVFSLYLDAVQRLAQNPNNLISIIFKNQGEMAGASQQHAHSQIVGSRVVPAWIRNAMHQQERYFDQHGECTLCAMLKFELNVGERIVADTDQMVILSPYAAAAPYELWVIPKRHFACFTEIKESEITSLAASIRQALATYVEQLGNPDFNYFLHSSPYPMSGVPFYHFFIQIVPRLWNSGGFETGTGMAVNPIAPETVPEFLMPEGQIGNK